MLFVLLILIALSTVSTIGAQGPTLSPTPTGVEVEEVSEDEVRQSLQERLKKAAEEKTDEAEKVLGSSSRVAVIGRLTDMANGTLTIVTKASAEELVATGDETTLVRKGETVELQDIQIGDYVIAMGYRNGDGVLEVKRLVATDEPFERPKRTILRATVGEINLKNKSFTVTDDKPTEIGGPDSYTVTVPKTSELDLEELKAGQLMILVGSADKDDDFSLTLRVSKILE